MSVFGYYAHVRELAAIIMVQTPVKLTFEDFLEQYPDGYGIHELVNGEIVKVEPTRAHKNVARFLLFAFNDEASCAIILSVIRMSKEIISNFFIFYIFNIKSEY